MKQPTLDPQRVAAPALAVFSIALALRWWHLFELRSSPFFVFLLGDADRYDAWARSIAAGHLLSADVFYQAPLYPYFLAAIYAALGDAPWITRGLQALIGATSCALLTLAGSRYAGRGAGLAAGLLLACYAPAIFFDGLIQKSVLDLFFLCALLVLLPAAEDRPRRRTWLVVGATVGALVMLRENALLVAAVVMAWPLTFAALPGARRAALSAAFAAGFLGALLPAIAHNAAVSGKFHLTTSQLGTNLYIGNNPEATGSYIPLRAGRGSAKFERQDAFALAREATGRDLSPSEVSDFWTRRAVAWALGNPGDWLRLTGRKFALLLDAVEAVDTEDQYTVADASTPLRLAGAIGHFGVLAPLAVLGVFTTWSFRRRLAILLVLTATYAASVLLFYVVARYRFPLVPFLAIYAGAGIAHVAQFAREAKAATLVAAVLAVVSTAVFANWPRSNPQMMRAVTHYNLGNAYKVAGDPENAVLHYREALARTEDFFEAHHNLAATYASLGRVDEALAHYRRNLARNPSDALALNNIANLLRARGEYDEAERHYERAIAVDPHYVEARRNLGAAQIERGATDRAIETFEALVAHAPTTEGAQRQLGELLSARGDTADALPHLEAALREEPEASDLLLSAAWLLSTHPDAAVRNGDRAVAYAERVIRLGGRGSARALGVLAAAQAEAGDFAAARATANRALTALERPGGRRERALRAQLDGYEAERAHRSRSRRPGAVRRASPDRFE